MSTPVSRSFSARRRISNVWDVGPDDTVGDSTRPLPFLAFFTFGFPVLVTPRLGIPINELGPAVAVLVAVWRPAQVRVPPWLATGLVLVVAWLAVISYANGLTPYQRLLHVGLYAVLALCLASGRVHVPSASRGMVWGLLVSLVASYAGAGPQNYDTRLAGTIGDPNLAGFLLVVLGCLAVGALPRSRLRWLAVPLFSLGVVLTLSRTTLLAALFAAGWLMIGGRVRFAVGSALVAAYVWVAAHIPDDLRLFGPFADRVGSDELRLRQLASENADVALHPILGGGAGTAQVRVGDNTFFYHSSYLAVQREGGLVLVVLIVLLIAAVFVSLVRMPSARRNRWYEAAIISLMVVAVNLGEVLLELPAAVSIGIGAWHAFQAPPDSVTTLRTVDDADVVRASQARLDR